MGDLKAEVIPMGAASLAEIATGQIPRPTEEELEAAEKLQGTANTADVAEKAVKKLKEELEKMTGNEKAFADPCVEYLIGRCEESESLAKDICQSHKTWKKCYGYIFGKAKKYLSNVSGSVRSDIVFEWVEDYYHLDDKAQEEKKAMEEAERKKKEAERQKQETVKAAKDGTKTRKPKAKAEPAKKEEKPVTPKPEAPKKKSKKNELEGQMDLFSMLGM